MPRNRNESGTPIGPDNGINSNLASASNTKGDKSEDMKVKDIFRIGKVEIPKMVKEGNSAIEIAIYISQLTDNQKTYELLLIKRYVTNTSLKARVIYHLLARDFPIPD